MTARESRDRDLRSRDDTARYRALDLRPFKMGLTNGAWRGGRVVECTALEMRRAWKGTVGSNPTLSATIPTSKSTRDDHASAR